GVGRRGWSLRPAPEHAAHDVGPGGKLPVAGEGNRDALPARSGGVRERRLRPNGWVHFLPLTSHPSLLRPAADRARPFRPRLPPTAPGGDRVCGGAGLAIAKAPG